LIKYTEYFKFCRFGFGTPGSTNEKTGASYGNIAGEYLKLDGRAMNSPIALAYRTLMAFEKFTIRTETELIHSLFYVKLFSVIDEILPF
jgi:hypothetical protein